MIKVCHITSAHPVEDGRIFHKECHALSEAGFQVFLVQQGESYIKDGISVVGFGKVEGSKLKRIVRVSKKAIDLALKIDADIYHLHDPEMLLYARKIKRRGKVVIFDSHEVYADQILFKSYLKKPFNTIVSALYKKFERNVLNSIDAVIVSSLRNKEFPIVCDTKHKIVIDNLPGLELYNSYNADEDKIPESICCFGTLAYSRGITHLIKAAYSAKAQLYLAGYIHSQEYKEQIEAMKEAECMEYLGVLKPQDVVSSMKKMLVGSAVLLNVGQYNKDDNLPTKAYEYMALGIPVLLSKCRFNEQLNSQYSFGICVDPDNIDEFSFAIRELLDNPKKAKEMGQNGRALIKNRFNWDREKIKLIELYKELVMQETTIS